MSDNSAMMLLTNMADGLKCYIVSKTETGFRFAKINCIPFVIGYKQLLLGALVFTWSLVHW